MKGFTKPSQIAGPPSMVTWLATPSSAARRSIASRSAASTPPVSANTVCTFQPRSFSHGTQKLVSRPPEKARTMSVDSEGAVMWAVSGVCGGRATGGSADGQCLHHRLLHVQAVAGFLHGDA